jgi:hypothetical protein
MSSFGTKALQFEPRRGFECIGVGMAVGLPSPQSSMKIVISRRRSVLLRSSNGGY